MTCRRLLIILLLVLLLPAENALAARLKDITHLQGVRQNQLIGYGLVVGLNASGDDQKINFTIQSLTSMLSRLGVKVDPSEIRLRNVAAVVVTANLPPFAKSGAQLDVQVSSIGNAKSLLGGTLLLSPLRGADGQIYAVAQGALIIGGYAFGGGGGGGSEMQKNHPTVGRIPAGALVEKELPYELNDRTQVVLSLIRQDFTTAARICEVINAFLGGPKAQAHDAGAVTVEVPEAYQQRVVELMSQLENLQVVPDHSARVVLNERTGTVVMGSDVRISTIAIAHGNLKIHISNKLNVSQPGAFSKGSTTVTPEQKTEATEEVNKLAVVPEGVSIGEVVMALNALGVSSRELIDILQAIKSAGLWKRRWRCSDGRDRQHRQRPADAKTCRASN